MDFISLFFLLLLGALGWFWFDGMRALEVARNVARQTCKEANVFFLDDTVASIAIVLARNNSGRMTLRRTYRFEFSETGDNRLEGRLILFGNRVDSITMEPYRILH